MPKFTHLHVHSHYSLLDGLPKIDEILDYVKELGMDSVALTDHGVLYGAVEFFKKAKQKGVKPIIGAEMYMAFERMQQKRPNIDDKRYHLVLLVKNEEGYKNLVKLITLSHLEGFYYKPRIDEETLAEYSSGLICLSGCIQGKIPKLILSKKFEEAEKLAQKYQEIFGPDNFYLEIQNHPNSPDYQKSNQGLITLSKKLAIPLVATNDIHYLKPEDAEAQDILMLINTGANLNDPERLTMKSDDFSMRSPEEMTRLFKNTPQAIENTQKIAELCNFEFVLGKTQLPYFEVPEGKTPEDYLKELCYQGLEKRLQPTHHPLTHHPTLNRKEVIDRLEYELSVIKETGFASYFLIVQDFVNWAKENRIVVGPGRGSVGGSLVAYLLNITNVNPLKYDLLFERFLHLERSAGLPDIDLDFTDRRRDEVINYVAEKYGRDKVAQIITFGTMAARAAVRDVGRALGYSYIFCDRIAKMIPFGFNLDQTLSRVSEFHQIYETDEEAKKLIDFAKKLEGVARHASTHACGVVISRQPLTNLVPLQHPTQNDKTIITQYEMYSIEDLGLLKMDLLGLKNLTIIEDTLARIYKVQGKSLNIEKVPFDDKKTFKLLREANTTGVFQLESDGCKRYLKQLKPTEFEDITTMVALYRPGPMQLIPEYIQRKHKKKKIEYLHPKLKPILEKTYGLPVYQESLMKIAQELAGFSLSEADVLRKAIGKKIKSLLLKQKEKMIQGMLMNNDIKKEIAQKIWEWILPFASYGFNRAHSVAYATIAYQTAYLKAHYPVEFMAALLTSEKADVERIAVLIEECKKMGIEVLAPNVNESIRNFTVIPKENKIRFGLLAIKNVGQNVVEAIIQEKKASGPFQSIDDFLGRVSSKDLNKKSLESLIKTGVFDEFAERNQLLSNLERLLEIARETQKAKLNGQKGLFDGMKFNSKIILTSAPPASENQKLNWEKELLGLYISSHPLRGFEKILRQKTISINEVKKEMSEPSFPYSLTEVFGKFRRIRVGGIISRLKKILTKNGKPMLFMKVEDLTDQIEVVVFPSVIEKKSTLFRENKIVLVTGRLDTKDEVPKIICEDIEEIIEET
ncbi:MAG: DNA polymerase III subunit alpha [Candidatus Nealsonbacteria bacterium CG03_land_8_20_14_0_80_36_12]|uniref:DNA polymerase III subunit alpha n=1 Tax=Candidatus Nealsonbacteria bacterium CG03_land_8_20_14_0_80_36_12 TaxID=1974701 RepID=A0A2M7BYE7_9BACT|nr:MAG: DNA polymerase III subunit alpha [Candidatus Nealsonbacteria bacterium CG03_land_8_20_14_0_80_36_12]